MNFLKAPHSCETRLSKRDPGRKWRMRNTCPLHFMCKWVHLHNAPLLPILIYFDKLLKNVQEELCPHNDLHVDSLKDPPHFCRYTGVHDYHFFQNGVRETSNIQWCVKMQLKCFHDTFAVIPLCRYVWKTTSIEHQNPLVIFERFSSKFRRFHGQFLIEIFRFCTILEVTETQLMIVIPLETWHGNGVLVTEGDPPGFRLVYAEGLMTAFFLSTLHAVCMCFLKLWYF